MCTEKFARDGSSGIEKQMPFLHSSASTIRVLPSGHLLDVISNTPGANSRSPDSEQTEINNDHCVATQVFSHSLEKDQGEEEKIQELNSEDSNFEEESIEGNGDKKAAWQSSQHRRVLPSHQVTELARSAGKGFLSKYC
jgi:hypothetical protein